VISAGFAGPVEKVFDLEETFAIAFPTTSGSVRTIDERTGLSERLPPPR
jgi:hypothetical protein